MQVGQEADLAAAPRAAVAEIEFDHDHSVGDEHLPRKRLLVLEWGEECGEDGIAARHHEAAR